MIHWADLIMISGGVFSFILFLGSMVEKNKKQIDWAIGWVYLCHSAIVVNKGLACSGMVAQLPWAMHIDLLFFYIVGPVMFYFLRSFSSKAFKLRKVHLLHFIPALMLIILYIPFLREETAWKLSHFPYYVNQSTTLGTWIYGASYLVPGFLAMIYLFRGLQYFPRLKEVYKDIPPIVIVVIAILALEAVIFSALMLWGYFNWSWGIYRIIMNGLNQIILCYFLLTKRFPQLFNHLKEEIRKNQGLIHLKADEIPRLIKKLKHSMETNRIYRDPELNLQGLGTMLNLSPHQLSELINHTQGQSFRKFLNEYRLNEACSLLKESNNLTVLEIAFQAGFHSKSSFNTLFKKELKMTPREYRDSK